jgi:Tfp pilus assembly PilM family ATPase
MMKKKESAYVVVLLQDPILRAVRYCRDASGRAHVTAFAADVCKDKSDYFKKIPAVLAKIGYAQEPVTVLLSHRRVSARYLTVPSDDDREIDRMVHFQSAKILPYPPQDVICGYERVWTDTSGYTHVYLLFVHREVVDACLDVLKELSAPVDAVYVGTGGLAEIVDCAGYASEGEVIAVMTDAPHADIVVARNGRICLSRQIKMESDIAASLFKHIMDTQSMYIRESQAGPIKKILLIGTDAAACLEALRSRMAIPVETIDPLKSIRVTAADIQFSESMSLALSIIQRPLPETMNMLPLSARLERRKKRETAMAAQAAISLALAAVLAVLGALTAFGRKEAFAVSLQKEVAAVAPAASQLARMQRRMEVLEKKQAEKYLILDFLYILHGAAVDGLSVSEVSYESSSRA